jgi:predicted HTH transcriptional regulator
LIETGESSVFEMKETLRWNLHTKRKDKAIEHSAAKSIAAFLNTDGGTLAIGVSDSGKVTGLGCENLSDRDAILRTFDNLTTNWMSDAASTMIKACVVQLEGHDILLAECSKGSLPVYVNSINGQEKEFYIRRQASSVKLNVDECVAYVQQRFRQS